MEYRIFTNRDFIPDNFLKALYILEHKSYPNLKEDEYYCCKSGDVYTLDIDFSEIIFLIKDRRVIGYYIVIFCGKSYFKKIVKNYIKKFSVTGKKFCIICDFVIAKGYEVYVKHFFDMMLNSREIDVFFANCKLDTSFNMYNKYITRGIFNELCDPVVENGFANVLFSYNNQI